MAVSDMIKNQVIHTEPKPTCYICGSDGRVLYQGLKDRLFGAPGMWSLKQCGGNPSCGLVWLDPMPVERDIGKLYATYFTHETQTVSGMSNITSYRKKIKDAVLSHAFDYTERAPNGPAVVFGYLAAQSRFLRERIGRSLMWLNGVRRGRLLDIGCGNGRFLVRMRDLGWEAVGFEPDTEAARIGRERYGLEIYSRALEDVGSSEDLFDAVTLGHVIEHLPDPLQTLGTANRLLKEGGRIVIATPNTASLGHRWFRQTWRGLEAPRHLFLFSPNALRKTVEKAGFKTSFLWTYSGSAAKIWAKSCAIKNWKRFPGLNPNDAYSKYYRPSGKIFLGVEHWLTGWPFRRPWGEELIIMAVKRS